MRLIRPSATEWSARLDDPRLTDLPFTQTVVWGEHKAHGGWHPLRLLLVDAHDHWIGAQLLVRPLPLGLGRFAYAARGPLIVAPDPTCAAALIEAFGAALAALEREQISLLRFEPAAAAPLTPTDDPVEPPAALRAAIAAPYAKIAVRCGALQPRSSSIIDLSGGLDAVRARYKSSQRSTLRTAERNDVRVRLGTRDDLPAFADVMSATAARARFAGRDAASYASILETHGPAAELLLAETPTVGTVGGLLLLHTRTTTTYLYAGSTEAGSALRATYALMERANANAVARGSARFDLWGLPTPGIAAFKAGWGGAAVAYAGGMEMRPGRLRGVLASTALRLRGGGRA